MTTTNYIEEKEIEIFEVYADTIQPLLEIADAENHSSDDWNQAVTNGIRKMRFFLRTSLEEMEKRTEERVARGILGEVEKNGHEGRSGKFLDADGLKDFITTKYLTK